MVSIGDNKLVISHAADDFYKAVADDFMKRANDSVDGKGVFNVALSGGNTPKKLYDLLTQEPYKRGVPWDKIQFFFGDERYVPANELDNNYFMAHVHLFTKVGVPAQNVYMIPTEYVNPKVAAEDYAATLRTLLHVKGKGIPKFDLIYLGLGTNAHTASLMPHTDVVKHYAKKPSTKEQHEITAALWVKELNMNRITFTPPIINNSAAIIFLVEGESKATPVWKILQGEHNPVECPAQLIKADHGEIIWFLDEASASALKLE